MVRRDPVLSAVRPRRQIYQQVLEVGEYVLLVGVVRPCVGWPFARVIGMWR